MVTRRKSLLSPTTSSISILEITSKGEIIQRTYGIKELLIRVRGTYKINNNNNSSLHSIHSNSTHSINSYSNSSYNSSHLNSNSYDNNYNQNNNHNNNNNNHHNNYNNQNNYQNNHHNNNHHRSNSIYSSNNSNSSFGNLHHLNNSNHGNNDNTNLPQRCLPIQYRDLRRLDFSYTPVEEPTILIRKDAILISLDPIRAIVTSDSIIIFLPSSCDQMSFTSISDHIEKSLLHHRGYSFELEAYEAILGTIVEVQRERIKELEDATRSLLRENKKFTIPPVYLQEEIFRLKQEINEKYERIKAYHSIIREVLESDEQLALMNLSYLQNHPQLYRAENISQILEIHSIVEQVLEVYLLDFNSLVTRFSVLHSSLRDTIDLIALRLDTAQNRIQAWDAVVGVGLAAFLLATYVPSLCGMNLKTIYFSEQSSLLFWAVTGITVGVGISFFLLALIFLRRHGVI